MADIQQLNNESIPLITRSNSVNAENCKQFLCASVALVTALSMGFSLGYSSPAIPSMKDEVIITTDDDASWFGSLLTIGAIVGGPLAGIALDISGRKITIILCAIPSFAGWVTIATVEGTLGLYIGRILTGFAMGMTSLSTPVYIAEMASPNFRGLLGSSFSLYISTGILLAYSIGIPLNYKYLALFGAAFDVILITMMSLMPETPRYMLIKGQRDKALKVLKWLRGPTVDVEIECGEIEDALVNQEPFSIKEFLQPTLFKPLLISVFLMFFREWSGINAVTFNMLEIFQTAAPSIEPGISSVIVGATPVLTGLVATLLMDKAGRRVLLIVSGIGLIISSTTLGLYYELTDTNNCTNQNFSFRYDIENVATTPTSSSNDLSWVSLTSMVVYYVAFSLGWSAIPYLIMSEIFHSKARATASSITTAFHWTFMFSVTISFSVLKGENSLGDNGVFWLYAVVSTLGVVFVALFVPETKGLTLEEIESKFGRRNIHGSGEHVIDLVNTGRSTSLR